MQRKLKVAHVFQGLSDFGGPSGYIKRLQVALQEAASAEQFDVSFLNREGPRPAPSFSSRILRNLRRAGMLFHSKIEKGHADYLRLVAAYYNPPSWEALSQFDLVIFHCHYLKPIGRCPTHLKYGFMAHSPTIFTQELFSNRSAPGGAQVLSSSPSFRVAEARERNAYLGAHFHVVPSVHSVDSYPPDLIGRLTKEKKIYYATTGSWPLQPTVERGGWRRKLNLREDDFLIAFVGRYHFDKGYDLYCEAARRVLSLRPSVRIKFISAGSVVHFEPSDLVVDVGQIQDIANLIQDCDLVVSANRHTYFDLLPLEVISLGKNILVTKTGGNIDLVDGMPAALVCDPTVESISEGLTEFIDRQKYFTDQRHQLRQFYETQFSLKQFAENHMVLYNNLRALVGR